MRRRSTLVIVLVTALLAYATPAFAVQGELDQLVGLDGCVSEDGTSATCENGTDLTGARHVAVAPDGKHVYVASISDSAVVALTRNKTTGELDMASCISEFGGGSCDDGVGMDGARNIAISPDGKNVYVASGFSSAVAIFKRNKTSGKLTQLAGTKACVDEIVGGSCADGNALNEPEAVVVSPDGKHVYVASGGSNAVAAFKRKTDGSLKQFGGFDGCISDGGSFGCESGTALVSPWGLAIAPDGKSLYVAAGGSDAVTSLIRNKTTGKLDQPGGTDACVSLGGGGCETGIALSGPEAVTVSPDGKHVYVASGGSDAVAAFSRNKATSALDQLPSAAACVNELGTGGCDDGIALENARGIAISADGLSVYVASGDSNAVSALSRDVASGDLDRLLLDDACVSEDGTTALCENGNALLGADGVAVSVEGKNDNKTSHVYVASSTSNSVSAFVRAQS